MTDKDYLLDTGVFVEAHRRWYRQDIVPGFWDALLHFREVGRLVSLDRCHAEISEGDALADWVAAAPPQLWMSTVDVAVANRYADVMAWANAGDYFTDPAKAEFARGADGWLVAYGAVHDLIVVTHETHEAERRNRVKVPNACDQFGVEWMDTFEMLRRLEVKFGWEP